MKRKRNFSEAEGDEEPPTKYGKRRRSFAFKAETSERDENAFDPDNIPYLHQIKKIKQEDIEYCQRNDISINIGGYTDKEKATVERNFYKFLQDYPGYEGDWLLGFGTNPNDAERRRFIAQTHFYARLAHGLPSRPAYNVFALARRRFHSQSGRRGEQYTVEEEQLLDRLFTKYGSNRCVEIGKRLSRHPRSIWHKFHQWSLTKSSLERQNAEKMTELQPLITCVSDLLQYFDNVKLAAIDPSSIDWSKVLESVYKSRCLKNWKEFRCNVSASMAFTPLDFISSIQLQTCENEEDADWKCVADNFNLADSETATLLYRCLKKYYSAVVSDEKRRSFRRTLKKMKRYFSSDDELTFRKVFDSGFV